MHRVSAVPIAMGRANQSITMTISVFIATSLDGYIAAEDGGLDWLDEIPNPDENDFGFSDFMAGIDAVVMGRTTFETVVELGGWPYRKPVFVLSRSLAHVPDHLTSRANVIQGTPGDIIVELEGRGFRNLYVDGGDVIQQFINAGLVDEMIVSRVSILLGSGIPLFANLRGCTKWRHAGTEVINEMLVQSRYVKPA